MATPAASTGTGAGGVIKRYSDVIVAAAIIMIVIMMIIPLPTIVLDMLLCFTKIQCLLVRIYTDKINTVDIFVNHSIYSIITCTADANYNDLCCRFSIACLNL